MANPKSLPSEQSPLLASNNQDPNHDYTGIESDDTQVDQTVGGGSDESTDKFQPSTFSEEAKVLAWSSISLMVTFFLQYSINFVSVFAAGRLGKEELGAVAVANMTTAVTCLAPFYGLATSLDTLCAQAYGDGRKHLVGLHCQRMVLFLFTLSIPVGILWMNSEPFLFYLLGSERAAHLSALYLKIMMTSIPGIILFEAGKRLLQAQGLFKQTTYVLMVAAPINVFVSWLLVWKLEWGFIGAPIAVAFTRNLLAILQIFYIKFINGHQCWGGFSSRALTNWWPMIKLALPGMVMVAAEWLAFEIMTFLSTRFGTDYLAAQSILITSAGISYQIPFALSVASSTRIANLIGAGLVESAKMSAKVSVAAFLLISGINFTLYTACRYYLPLLFTNEDAVIEITAKVIPLVAAVLVVDALSAGAHGILRGIGRQSIGGPANLFSYYGIALPLSLLLINKFGWKLDGLWLATGVGLVTVSVIEYVYVVMTDWEKAAIEAHERNSAN